MLGPELNDLRARLDALKEGRRTSAGLLRRALGALRGEAEVKDALEALRALDRDFDRAGVHTTADARLLLELGRHKGRVAKLASGLVERADAALAGYTLALDVAERKAEAGQLPPGLLTALEEDFVRLARAVKVAQLFSSPGPAKAPAASFQVYDRPARQGSAPDSSRLAAIEFLVRRAQDNAHDVGQKRRDLDVAYELMLRLVATNRADKDRLRQLRVEVSSARERVRRAPVVRSLQDAVRHLRHVARKDPAQAWRSVRGLYERALEAGDAGLAEAARGAVEAMLPSAPALAARLEADAEERLGLSRAAPAGEQDTVPGEALVPGGTSGQRDEANELLAQLAFSLDLEQLETLELSAGCMQYFDVEDALSEELVDADLGARRPVQKRVPYPTQHMTYEHTGSLSELSNFVIQHPGMVLHDLASNRQAIRAYIEETPPPTPKQAKKTAVRVYVLDASGSMHGARSRFRDAILIAELNAMRAKARAERPFDPLYFSYFNDAPTSLARVDTAADATRQIERLFRASIAEGQTDITLALISAFDSIRTAQGRDPYLARATVVLVTDGEDAVDLELVRRTKRPLEGVDIALSFISLGEENPDLRALVLEQRQTGARAFYHHLTDAEIVTARTEFDSTWRTLLPSDVPATPGLLEALLPHLEALEAIAQGLEAKAPERADTQFEALFPETPSPAALAPPAALLRRLLDMLEAIAEAAALAPAELRTAECVALLNHLLALYQVPLPTYLEALGSRSPALLEAVGRVRLLGKPFG